MPERRLQRTREAYAEDRAVYRDGDKLTIVIPALPIRNARAVSRRKRDVSMAYRITQAQLKKDAE